MRIKRAACAALLLCLLLLLGGCARQEQPLPKQELAEVYAQTLRTAKCQSRRRMLKVGIATVLTACFLYPAGALNSCVEHELSYYR